MRQDPALFDSDFFTSPPLKDLASITNPNIFENEDGYVRLYLVNKAFGLRSIDVGSYLDEDGFTRFRTKKIMDQVLNLDDLETITGLYVKWRDQREVMPIKKTYADDASMFCSPADVSRSFLLPQETFEDSSRPHSFNDKHGLPCSYYKGTLFYHQERTECAFKVTPKRGNDVYIDIIKRRFEPLLSAETKTFFDPSWGIKKTNLLYITLTTDPSKANHNIANAWLTFGKAWNSFITNLRNQYGTISYIRTWQSQDNYYPHAHALIYFQDQEFTAVRWKDQDGSISFRLPSRSHHRIAIKNAWKYGNCDIKCVPDTKTAYTDLLKYITRDLEGGAAEKTNSMVWFFEKQSFAISGNFFKNVALLEPSNADLIYADSDNSNSLLLRIDIFPIMGAIFVPETFQKTMINEDPPPDLINFFELLENQCDCFECKRSKKLDPRTNVFLWRKKEVNR